MVQFTFVNFWMLKTTHCLTYADKTSDFTDTKKNQIFDQTKIVIAKKSQKKKNLWGMKTCFVFLFLEENVFFEFIFGQTQLKEKG